MVKGVWVGTEVETIAFHQCVIGIIQQWAAYVACICCWFSSNIMLCETFLIILRFAPRKNCKSNITFDYWI